MDQHKISKLLKDSTLSKLVTKKLIEVNDSSAVNILTTKI